MRRKELPVRGHRKAWRQICVEFTHNSIKPALDIAHRHEMKSVLIWSPHTSGEIATRQEIKCLFSCQVQLPSPSSPSPGCSYNLAPSPAFFTPVFVLFLLLPLLTGQFWGRGLGEDRVVAFPLGPVTQASSPVQWTGSRGAKGSIKPRR